MAKLIEIEGIGSVNAAALEKAGVITVEELRQKGATPKGRTQLAEASGLKESMILKWINHADLFRINGIATQYAELLEAAGVDTVVELAHRKAENLYETMAKVNNEKNLVRKIPEVSQIAKWIEEAKTLPRMIEY